MSNDKSLFPSSQSMGSFGSLPIPPLGEEVGEFGHDHSRDDVENEPEAEERD